MRRLLVVCVLTTFFVVSACATQEPTIYERAVERAENNVAAAQKLDRALEVGDIGALDDFARDVVKYGGDPAIILGPAIQYGSYSSYEHFRNAASPDYRWGGLTLLMWAVDYCRSDIARDLLSRGADPNLTAPGGARGMTAIDFYRANLVEGRCTYVIGSSPTRSLAEGKEAAIMVAKAGGRPLLTDDELIALVKEAMEMRATKEAETAEAMKFWQDRSWERERRTAVVDETNALIDLANIALGIAAGRRSPVAYPSTTPSATPTQPVCRSGGNRAMCWNSKTGRCESCG